ncbi:sigma-54-dependent Fis family transcriptional regulator [bacterium]|nr:sigma-54-dependent Fis family transcriptional regulator [bacterium]
MEKILVIDDEEDVRQLMRILLAGEGYDVELAEDGEKGMALMDSFNPRVVILDLNMPTMGGIDFLKQLRPNDDMGRSIIILTGYGSDEDVRQCYKLGINSFLRKPVNIHEILGLIRRNLELIHFSEQLKREKIEKEKVYRLVKKTFDSMSEGVITLDSDFLVQIISDKACRMLNVTSDKILKKPAVSIVGNLVAGPSGILVDFINHQTETSEFHTQFQLSNGAIVPVVLTVKPLNGGRALEGWLLLFRDKREEEEKAMQKQVGGFTFGRLISTDNRMIDVFQLIDKIAPSDVSVLIGGESGTGKELVAREIHDRSRRAQKPFIAVNCAAIPAGLIESELFGHERGAFTDAVNKKVGRFELADGGTLFLDEIGDIPLEMQAKLLRVLEGQTFERVGGTITIRVNVRIIAATNHNLKDLIRKNLFREDLYYRLDVISLELPPLRDRIQDIPLLVSYFIKQLNASQNRHIKGVSSKVSLSLLSYSWPGNVRELLHVLESVFAVSQGDFVQYEHLPQKLKPKKVPSKSLDNLRKNEKEVLIQTLKQVSYDKRKASSLLGISLATLYRKIGKYKI